MHQGPSAMRSDMPPLSPLPRVNRTTIPSSEGTDILRFLGLTLDPIRGWVDTRVPENPQDGDGAQSAPATNPIPGAAATMAEPVHPPLASPTPPTPLLDPILTRDLEFHADEVLQRLDEVKRAIDRIFNSSRELETLLGRTHMRLGTLEVLTGGLEQDLLRSRNLSMFLSTLQSYEKNNGSEQLQSKVDAQPSELHPSDCMKGSPLSNLIDHLWWIASYERVPHPASTAALACPSVLLPPSRLLPKPSEETYQKMGLIARLADHLFPSPLNHSPSPEQERAPCHSTEPRQSRSDPPAPSPATSSLSSLGLPLNNPFRPPTPKCKMPPPPGLPTIPLYNQPGPSSRKPKSTLASPSRSLESLKLKAKELIAKVKALKEDSPKDSPHYWEHPEDWEEADPEA
ncbi:unnamed protein product [Rhizoctonia solani]|uniref:Uncharacterized protein n=1 Tax=Rhizoctonia solani TaxID=456999 RepID=A0A8H3HYK2_9AGAM|nr:unnamed protein product [Rhizoctonia solani]